MVSLAACSAAVPVRFIAFHKLNRASTARWSTCSSRLASRKAPESAVIWTLPVCDSTLNRLRLSLTSSMKISPLARAISPLAEEVAVLIWSAWADVPIAAPAVSDTTPPCILELASRPLILPAAFSSTSPTAPLSTSIGVKLWIPLLASPISTTSGLANRISSRDAVRLKAVGLTTTT